MASYTLDTVSNILNISKQEVWELVAEGVLSPLNKTKMYKEGPRFHAEQVDELEKKANEPIPNILGIEPQSVAKKAVYAGSFDLLTNGHLWMIGQASNLFDEVCVAVGNNREKTPMFSVEDRAQMLLTATNNISCITVESLDNQFPVKFAETNNYAYLLRGIRNGADFNFEQVLAQGNRSLSKNVVTVFLMPPPEYSFISSSVIKSMIGFNGWEKEVEKLVPPCVFKRLKKEKS